MPQSNRRPRSLLECALAYATEAHKHERRKFEPGPYIRHPEAVASWQRDIDERVVGLLHDVIELRYKEWFKNDPRMADGLVPREEQDLVVEMLIEQMQQDFSLAGFTLSDASARDLDLLTKRPYQTYKQYIERMIAAAHATGRLVALCVKLADLNENSDPGSNPKGSSLTAKDHTRLGNYAWAIARITAAFPQLKLRVPGLNRKWHKAMRGVLDDRRGQKRASRKRDAQLLKFDG